MMMVDTNVLASFAMDGEPGLRAHERDPVVAAYNPHPRPLSQRARGGERLRWGERRPVVAGIRRLGFDIADCGHATMR